MTLEVLPVIGSAGGGFVLTGWARPRALADKGRRETAMGAVPGVKRAGGRSRSAQLDLFSACTAIAGPSNGLAFEIVHVRMRRAMPEIA